MYFHSITTQHLYFRSLNEQYSWATDKLKQDLSEANARNSMLAKEVDERHAHLEQSSEKKLVYVFVTLSPKLITSLHNYFVKSFTCILTVLTIHYFSLIAFLFNFLSI